MGEKLVATIRFHPQGQEAELYQKLQERKENAGLSLPEYVKKILSEYFEDVQNRCDVETVLREMREEYKGMMDRVERTIQNSMREHDANLLGALGRLGTAGAMPRDDASTGPGYAQLPEESRGIPEGALDFLGDG